MPDARARSLFLTSLVMVATVLASLVMVATAPRAAAHDVLLEASPADGETLTEAPDQVTLTFSNELIDSNRAIVVTDSSGQTVAEGAPALDGATATLEVPEPLADGDYTVTWSVVSSDGHRVEGEYPFTVAADDGEEATSASGSTTTAGVPESTATPDEAGTSGELAGEDSEATGPPLDLPPWAAIAVGLAILAGLVMAIVRLVRSRR
ncbi:hypothetical protein GCM10023169_26750 [Georgenia halophila]|uniref:CopC domain-containing protein n=1 Tax=Georgenia halophila TaxID=620889 RepID=A0ABP8LDY0_9MICO